VQGKGRGGPAFRSSVIPVSSDQASKKQINEGSGTPANAGYHRRILRCGARPFGARTLDGVPPRLSPKGIIPSQRLSFRPGFLGRGLNGRYPPSPVPVQGSTSHPGHNAGRHDTQAAREQPAKPPAGTALAPMPRCASAPCPSLERDCDVTVLGTHVKSVSLKKIRRGLTYRHNVRFTPSKPRSSGASRIPLGRYRTKPSPKCARRAQRRNSEEYRKNIGKRSTTNC
jgi:hypothetical protein